MDVAAERDALVIRPVRHVPRQGWAEMLAAVPAEALERDTTELAAFRETPHDWDSKEWHADEDCLTAKHANHTNEKSDLSSGQHQAVALEWSEVRDVAGRQWGAATQGDSSNLTVGKAAGTSARGIEQLGGFSGIHGNKRLRWRQESPGQGFVLRSERTTEELAPRDGADAQVFTRPQPSLQTRRGGGTGYEGLDDEVGVEVNHPRSAAGLADSGLPFSRFGGGQLEPLLQRPE